jgi:hypothetical protein
VIAVLIVVLTVLGAEVVVKVVLRVLRVLRGFVVANRGLRVSAGQPHQSTY